MPSLQTKPVVDLRRVFDALPTPIMLLTPEFVIVDMNDAYLTTTSRARSDLLDRDVFDVFPDNPNDPNANGVTEMRASFERVLALREADTMKLQRYDVFDPGSGGFRERYWSPINVPVLDDDGTVAFILARVVDVTEFVNSDEIDDDRASNDELRARHATSQTELVVRAAMLRSSIEGMRAAQRHEHERSEQLSHELELESAVATTLQHTMLPHLKETIPGVDLAARYVPADTGLEVGGDWFDVIEGEDGMIGLVVGDVVGRGLNAAAVMGQLRSATGAALLATQSPSETLVILDRFARTVDGAYCATAFSALVDVERRKVSYSSAGHPPAVVVHRDGTCELLEAGRGLPLGIYAHAPARTEATALLPPGSTIVLYTDGLVERRGETIDAGIQRLANCLTTHRSAPCDRLADLIVSELALGRSRKDDVALTVLRILN